MGNALAVAGGFFPLDQELELVDHGLTPHLLESLVRLGAWIPFKAAAVMIEVLTGAVVSEETVRRLTEETGAAYVEVQTREVERIERELPAPVSGGDKLLLAVDGAMVSLLHKEWAEAKTLVIGQMSDPSPKDGTVRAGELSYFSRLTDAETFTRLSLVETQRRGVESALKVGAVSDGAEWEQGFIDMHRADAVRILDFAHAAQRLTGVAEAVWGEGSGEAQQWREQQWHTLKHEGPGKVLAELRGLSEDRPELRVLSENLAYLAKREEHMQYPDYTAQGWPLGSGVAESANKVVVEGRLKGGGMHWARGNVDPMLALRNIVYSDRWDEEWPRITTQLRRQAADGREERRRSRRALKAGQEPQVPAATDPPMPPAPRHREVALPLTAPTQVESSSSPPQSTPKAKEPHRPGPDHPWRHSPIGKARLQPYHRQPDAKL